ncbi:recombinase family protein [Corynebacterium sp. H128]|uniref:recombinase family protein n=1 Tax=Corynebacterium sp. H128 TaxID=3133427 RepID=UPI0030B2C94A
MAGQIIGYARVSTTDQNPERQHTQLTAAGATRIYTDAITGSTRHRPQLDEALRYLRDGDQLTITSMDRLARSLTDLSAIVTELTERGITVKFLKENQTYTADADPIAQLMLGILGSIAQFERSLIRERQAEGIARAKARGVYTGRAPALTDEQVTQAKQWIGAGVPKAEVARRLGIGRTTLYKYLAT